MHPLKLFCIAAAALGVAFLSFSVQAADDPGVAQLRNDVRTLEREVRELSRRVDQLQQGQGRSVTTDPPASVRRSTAPDSDPRAWLAPEKWDRLRPGMTAQEVIVILGPPVSMRSHGTPAVETLFYTLAIGDGGFLSGTVRLQDDKVMEIERPVLKPQRQP